MDATHEWSEVPGAVQYWAQIDTLGGGFSSPVADTLITDTFWYVQIWPGFFEWRVAAYDGASWSAWSGVWTFESRFPVSNEPDAISPPTIVVERIYPNPSANKIISIRFGVFERTRVDLRIFDSVGREVATIYQDIGIGTQEIQWDANSLPAGTYFLLLRSATASVSRKIVLTE